MDPIPIVLIDALAAREAAGNGVIEPPFAHLPEPTQNRYRDQARAKLRALEAPHLREALRRWVAEMPS